MLVLQEVSSLRIRERKERTTAYLFGWKKEVLTVERVLYFKEKEKRRIGRWPSSMKRRYFCEGGPTRGGEKRGSEKPLPDRSRKKTLTRSKRR